MHLLGMLMGPICSKHATSGCTCQIEISVGEDESRIRFWSENSENTFFCQSKILNSLSFHWFPRSKKSYEIIWCNFETFATRRSSRAAPPRGKSFEIFFLSACFLGPAYILRVGILGSVAQMNWRSEPPNIWRSETPNIWRSETPNVWRSKTQNLKS